jgi:hypothetical protein
MRSIHPDCHGWGVDHPFFCRGARNWLRHSRLRLSLWEQLLQPPNCLRPSSIRLKMGCAIVMAILWVVWSSGLLFDGTNEYYLTFMLCRTIKTADGSWMALISAGASPSRRLGVGVICAKLIWSRWWWFDGVYCRLVFVRCGVAWPLSSQGCQARELVDLSLWSPETGRVADLSLWMEAVEQIPWAAL